MRCHRRKANAISLKCKKSRSVCTTTSNNPCRGKCMDTIDNDVRDTVDMKRLISGHDAALNDLMERHAEKLFQFLWRMVGNEDDANDLAQETFVRVFRSCKSFKIDQKFSAWLYAIA